jgi:RHS repeat-associated protein
MTRFLKLILVAATFIITQAAYAQTYPVRWADLIGVTESGGVLTKTAASASWLNSSATSSNYLAPNTDGSIQFTFSATQTQVLLGFVTNNFYVASADAYQAGLNLNASGTIFTHELAVPTSTFGNVTVGDVFKISREGSQFKYYKNGVVIRTVSANAALPLYVRADILDNAQTSPLVTASFDAKVLIKPTITGTSATANTGTISLNVEGGRAPYTYSWSSGETTSSISSKAFGNYTVTVTDADSRTATSTLTIGYKVGYSMLTNVTESNGILTKVGGAGWNAGADASNKSLSDAWVEFTVTDYSSAYIVGIFVGADMTSPSFRNAIIISSDYSFYTVEVGTTVSQGAYRIGDVFRIARVGTDIRYSKNGVVFRTVAAGSNSSFYPRSSVSVGSVPRITSSVDARVGASADVVGTSVANGTGSISLVPYGGVAPYTYSWAAGNGTSANLTGKVRGAYTATITDAEGRTMTKTYNVGYNMIYTDLVNATESNGIVTKTVDGWNGGGFTSNMVLAGTTDAWFEWVVPQSRTAQFIVGAQSYMENSWAPTELKMSMGYQLTGNAPTLFAYEAAAQYTLGVSEPGDVLRVERTGGNLIYKQNGTVLRTVATSNIEWRIKVASYTGSAPRITSSFDARPLIRGTVTGTQAPDNTSGVTTTVVGGKTPYAYSWSSAETTSSIASKARGTYTLTVTDADGRVATKLFKTGYNVSWANLTNLSAGAGNTLTKTSANGWNSSAIGTNIIPSNTDGWLEYVIDNSNSNHAIGFSSQDAVTDPTLGMRFAIVMSWSSTVSLLLNGSTVSAGAWQPGDVFRIGREGGNITVYRNGTQLYTYSYPAINELKPKVSVNSGGVPNVVASVSSTILPIAQVTGTGKADGTGGISLTTTGGYGSYTYAWTSSVGPVTETTATLTNKARGRYTVTITDGSGASVQRSYNIGYRQDYTWLWGVSASANALTRTASGTGWGSGANSYNVLPANTDGYIELVAQDVTSYYSFGFGQKISTLDIADYKNAFTVNGITGAIGYYEGTNTAGLTNLKPGDVLKVSREGSNVLYYKNGVVLRTIATNAALELYMKTEVNAQGSPSIMTSFDTAPVLKTVVAGGASNSTTGSVSLAVEGGTAPYTYSWSSGETTSSITAKPFGSYTVTVNDAEGRQVVRTYALGYKNYLTEQLNLVPNGSETYSGSTAPAGANSTNIIPEGATNDWIEWVHQANIPSYQVGFGWNDYNFGPIEFLYSLGTANNGVMTYYENANSGFTSNCQPGDVFRIARESGNIKYYRNGVVIRTIAMGADYELKPKFYIANGAVPPIICSRDTQILPIATVAGTGKNNSGGSITVTPVGGNGGYTYNWGAQPGTTGTQTNLSRGSYTVTVTDNQGRTASRTFNVGYRPQLQTSASVTDNANSYTKTGSTNYDGGAVSSGYIPASTDGWMEIVVPSHSAAHIYRMGFSWSDVAYSALQSLRNGFEFTGQRRILYIEGTGGGTFGNILPGDVLRIERVGGSINYLRNGVVKRTIAVDATLELHWKLALAMGISPKVNTSFDSRVVVTPAVNGISSTLNPGNISVTPTGGTSPYTYSWSPNVSTTSTASPLTSGSYSVTVTDAETRATSKTYAVGFKPSWTSLTGVNVSGQGLLKTAAVGWNAGALTSSPMPVNQDGWTEFTIPSNNETYIVGLTTSLTSFLNTSFKHSILIDAATSTYYVNEDAVSTYNGSYQIGDVFRIERTGSSINYKRNGVTVKTSTTTPSIEYRLKVAINAGSAPAVASSFEVGEASVTLNNWAFQYKYDARRRMIAKRAPGADWVYMVYDDRDRLVLSQDGAMRPNKQWQFTKYDSRNRAVLTGIMTAGAIYSQEEMTQQVTTFYTTNTKYAETRGNVIHGYTNDTYPSQTDPYVYWTVTYYDDYDWINGVRDYADSLRFSPDEFPEPVVEAPQTLRTNGLVTGAKVKVIDGSPIYLYSATYYDDKARVIQMVGENYKLGHDRTTNILDFAGRIKQVKVKHWQSDLTWKDKTGMVESGRLLVNNSPSPTFPYCTGFSTQVLPANTDGWVEMIAGSDNEGTKLGFTSSNTSNLDHAISLNTNGSFRVYNGTNVSGDIAGAGTPVKKGERVRIARIGSTIRIYRNGVEVTSARVTTGVNTGQLYVGASVYSSGQFITAPSSSISGSGTAIWREMNYDAAGRLTKVWHTVGNGPKVLLIENEFDELSRLVDRGLHSTDGGATHKQSVDYDYNIRGWLTKINGSDLASNVESSGTGGDLFGMDLLYNDVVATIDQGKEVFNGNISSIKWSANTGIDPMKQKAYQFQYDEMNRMKTAGFREKSTTWAASGKFSENIDEYDLNGNIVRLTRNGASGTQIDNLVYSYGTGGERSNKLLKVGDTGNKQQGFIDGANTDNDYTYDANGNIITDKNKSINANITYLYPLNLPTSILRAIPGSVNGSGVGYIYDATGRKLQQTANYYNSRRTTDYNGDFLYEDDQLQSIQHEEGRVAFASRERIAFNDGTTTAGTAPLSSTVTVDDVNLHNQLSYLKVVTTAGATSPGLFMATDIPVVAGETYVFRVKGFLANVIFSQPWLKIRYVQPSQTVDVYRTSLFPAGQDAESSIEQNIIIPANTPAGTTISIGLAYEGVAPNSVTFYVNDFDFYRLESTPPEYQYDLKDHLGNVRLTFTTKDATESSIATLENSTIVVEQSQFLRYDNARRVSSFLFDHTSDAAAAGSATVYSNNFSTDFTPILKEAAIVLAIESGRLKATNVLNSQSVLMTLATIPGKNYKVTADIDVASGGTMSMIAHDNVVATHIAQLTINTNGTYSYQFTAQSASTLIQFMGISAGPRTFYVDNLLIEDVSPGGVYAERLNGSTNEKYGLARSLAVMPGDVIKTEVWAKYVDTSTANWTPLLTTLLSQVAGGTMPTTRIDGSGYTSSTSSFPFGGLSNTAGSTGGPKAYLNWLIFDQNMVLLDGGYRRLSATPKESGQNVPHEKLEATIPITHSGFVYVYLSNEESTPIEVYFDDFKVDQVKMEVTQSQDYYPFGLTFNQYQRTDNLKNPFQYNGKEIQDEVDLGWLDFGARMYSPELGRWAVVDPLADKSRGWTPYRYAFNNPLKFTDPDGMFEYSNGYTTTNSWSETGSVEHWQLSGEQREQSATERQVAVDGARARADMNTTLGSVETDSGTQTPQTPQAPGAPRPCFDDMWNNYPVDEKGRDLPVDQLYPKVGGQIEQLYLERPEAFGNGCALRMSVALNKSGVPIPEVKDATWKGSDGKNYFVSAAKLLTWTKQYFGKPDIEATKDFAKSVTGFKGMYFMEPGKPGGFGATGHATVFNDFDCIGGRSRCFFNVPADKGGTYRVSLWKLD